MDVQPPASTDVRERHNTAAVAAGNKQAAVAASPHQFIGSPPRQVKEVDPQMPDGDYSHKPEDVALHEPFVIYGPKYVGEEWTPCPDEVRTVPFAFSCGNWSILKKNSARYTYMIDDLNVSPGHVGGCKS